MQYTTLICAIIALFPYTTVLSHFLNIRNNCPYTVWPAIWGQGYIPKSGGWRMNPGQSERIDVPYKWTAGRVWGRTNCNEQTGRCETGDCGRGIQCNGATARAVTLAEITFDGWGNLNNYDISLVDGYNIPVSMKPTPGTYSRQPGVANSCTTGACLNHRVLTECPQELRIPGICQSACERYNTDQYCCRGQWNNPNTCPGASLNRHFKDRCPAAYSYAYDDANGALLTCPASGNSGFDITFCG